MYKLKSIGVLSVAKIMGAIYGVIGLIFLPILLIAGIAGALNGGNAGALGAAGAVILAIVAPVFYGGIGFVSGAIGALLYNLFARWIGGIELELQTPATLSPQVLP